MTPKLLLQECEKLPYGGRMRRMVELGRLASSDASISKTLATLAQGDVYQRILATQACNGSRDSAQVLRALSDPSRSVRSLALGLAILICSDSELQTVLGVLPFDIRMVLVRRLHKQRRQVPIDTYLETLASRSHADLKAFLPFGSREVVGRYLDRVSEQLDLVTWRRLVRQYPDLVVAQLGMRVTANETLDPQLIIQVNNVLPLLAQSVPDLVLDLVKTFVSLASLARLSVQPLVLKRPNEMVDLLLQTDEQSRIRFDTVAHRLDTEHLLVLFTRYPDTLSNQCFEKLRPEQRLAAYTVCERGWRNEEGVLPYHIVAALPAAQRLHEGRRHLALPVLATRPLEQFPYVAFLPWDEVRAFLNTPLRSPDANLRGVTLRTLIASVRYQREHLPEVLQLVRNRRNEQDPVRREMLTALADLPHGIWKSEHLDDLAQIIHDALNATDLSPMTSQSIERLVVYLFPFHPEWSAGQMAILYRGRGQVSFFQLDRYISDEDIKYIAPILSPILHSWQKRESERLLVALAMAFGRRLRVFDELADLLETVLNNTLDWGVVGSILNFFLEYRHERVYLLIPRLLRHDKSAIIIKPIYVYLHRHRQDLITPFLGQHAYKGRFGTGSTRFVLPLNDGFQRWTPTQQETFSQTLLEILHEKEQNRAIYEWILTIKRLAFMPFINPTPLIQFASDERPPVREAALRALGGLDAGQGVPALLEALNDERARIAIYALRSALLSLPQEEALSILRTVPFTQVTVAKEVVRLIGDVSSQAAYRDLLDLDTRDLHRDVRVALLRALWPYVEQAETWDVFTRAAQAPEIALARGVVHIPADGMSPSAQKRLATLIATLLEHPAPEVRVDVLQRCSAHPIADNEHTLFSHLLTLLNSPSPDECSLAAKTLFAIYTGNDASLVGNALHELLSNRRALKITVESFLSVLRSDRNRLLPTTRAILAVLSNDRLTLSLRIPVLIAGLPWQELGSELIQIANILHADALGKALAALQLAASRPDAQLFELETALVNNEDERLRRLALAVLIAQSRQASGWSDEAIARLQLYREDPSSLVAEAAQFTFTS